MLEGFSNASRIPELRRRLLFTAAMLVVYRVGVAIPTPGIDGQALSAFFDAASSTLFGWVNLFSGGALERFSIFALGIMPYISVAIILDLLKIGWPYLDELYKEGEAGRRKIAQYTRYGTVGLAFIQGTTVACSESARSRIPAQYTRRVVAFRVYGGQSSHLPLKVNTSGVIPPIFASSILVFPATLATFVPSLKWLSAYVTPGGMVYNVAYVALIIFFCYFYTAVTFNPVDVADNLKKYGGFIPGIRPGRFTAEYIDRVLSRITLGGAIYVSAVCVLPTILTQRFNVPFYFGGTALLIVVGVALDTGGQIETHLLSRNYEGFMGRGRIKSRGKR